MNTYCGGLNGNSWNNELPYSWNGATCVSTNSSTCDNVPGLNAVSGGFTGVCAPSGTGWNGTKTVGGNNGTVSMNTYCGGLNGNPWNGELPYGWNGATCVSTNSGTCDNVPGLDAVSGGFSGVCRATGTGWNGTKTVGGNNGSVSMTRYCGGTQGGPWNGELPVGWNGATCVSTNSGTCDTPPAPVPPSGYTGVCRATGTGWNQ